MRLLSCLLGLALLTACDEDDHPDGEGPTIDAAPDFDGSGEIADAGPDAASGSLTVIVRSELSGRVFPGATVLVLDEDEALRGTTLSDEAGLAIVEVSPGDSLVVLREEGEVVRRFATHVVGVEPGDVLRVGRERLGEPVGELTVNASSMELADNYRLQSGCGEVANAAVVDDPLVTTLFSACHGSSNTTPALLVAEAGQAPIAYQVASAHDFSAPLVAKSWRNDFLRVDSRLTGAIGIGEFSFFQLFLFAEDGEDFELDPSPLELGVPEARERWDVPQDLASHWLLRARVSDEKERVARTVDHLAAWPVTDVALVYPDDFLPRLDSVEVSGQGIALVLGYQLEGDRVSIADAAQFFAGFDDGSLSWLLVHPGTATSAMLPALPNEYADFLPGMGETPAQVRVSLVDVDLEGGYDEVRGGLGSEIEDDDFAPSRAIFAGEVPATLRSSTRSEELVGF